jgi:hypothetical protein
MVVLRTCSIETLCNEAQATDTETSYIIYTDSKLTIE